MLVHLSALTHVVRRGTAASYEELELLVDLEGVLGVRLVDQATGRSTPAAERLVPSAAATLATADAFFSLADALADLSRTTGLHVLDGGAQSADAGSAAL